MRINERRMGSLGHVTILDIHGKMTQGDGRELLKEKIDQLVRVGRVNIVLNLVELTFIGSSGLGEMVHSYRKLTASGGRLKLLNPCWEVKGILKDSRVAEFFEIFQDETESINSFPKPRRTARAHERT